MKTVLRSVAAVLAVALVCSLALAEEETDGAKLRRALRMRLSPKKFAKADTDGDGHLSASEIAAAKASGVFDPGGWGLVKFREADKNHDGKVSPAEARAARYYSLVGRIQHGIKSGALTSEEAQGLIETQKEIHGMRVEARSDGKVTRDERVEIRKAVHEQSKAIFQEKHDAEGKKLPLPPPTATPGVTVRQGIQKGRIGQGIKSGELTKGETKALIGGQKKLQHMKRDMKSDGKVTLKERKILHKAQNNQSKKIYRLKHNEKSRPKPKPRPRPRRRR